LRPNFKGNGPTVVEQSISECKPTVHYCYRYDIQLLSISEQYTTASARCFGRRREREDDANDVEEEVEEEVLDRSLYLSSSISFKPWMMWKL
jgi:hypothetical protein